jgi:hypothetical protein
MLIEQPPPQVTPRLLEQILAARSNLVALRVGDVERILAEFRQIALRSGQSIYLWRPDSGVVSLRDTEMRVPGGLQLHDALLHVLQSIHFGVYLITGFEDALNAPVLRVLRRIARVRTGNDRKVVFVGTGFVFPGEIEETIEYISMQPVAGCQPRLRDGRWVL